MTLRELAARVGARLHGNGDHVVSRCAGLEEADADAVSFLANRRYAKRLKHSNAGAIVVSEDDVRRGEGRNLLVSDNPYFSFREAVVALHGVGEQPASGISTLASVDDEVTVGVGCSIGPFAVVRDRTVIGRHTTIHANVTIGADVRIGDDCIIYPGVVIYDGCEIGDRVAIHANTVIGEDGFGYATHKGVHHKIPQIGSVIIEDDVEIGAACAIDRGTLGPTRIGKGTKFSNLIAIGHGSTIGAHNLFVAQVGIAGSVKTGEYVAFGGQAGVVGHVTIGDRAQIAAKAGVVANVAPDAKMGGYAAIPLGEMKRVAWEVIHLPDLAKQVKELERKIRELEQRRADGSTSDGSPSGNEPM